jgi:uncharacterized membrane protein
MCVCLCIYLIDQNKYQTISTSHTVVHGRVRINMANETDFLTLHFFLFQMSSAGKWLIHIFILPLWLTKPDVLTLRVNSHIWSNLHIYICLCTHISEVYVTTRRLNTTCKFAQIVYYNLIQFTYIYIYVCVCLCIYLIDQKHKQI